MTKEHYKKEMEDYKENLEKAMKEGIMPRCSICQKPMVNAIDSKTKKISKYLWRTTCSHSPNLRLSIG